VEAVEYHHPPPAAGALGVPPRFVVGFASARAAQVRSGLVRVIGTEVVDCPR
jgi:hypothetical protein